MNKSKIIRFQIFSLFFIFILGSFFHFTYELSGENKIIAIFSSVNESVWEHLKLVFFPMLLTIIIGIFVIGKDVPNFICSKTLGIICSIFFLIIFFYTYTGILGKNIALIDISLFFISTILGEFVAYLLMINKYRCKKVISVAYLIIQLIFFILFTFNPPKLGIFKDPITGKYGIQY